jgi:hypothetical protein
MKNKQVSITIDDRKIKKFINAAKVVIKSMHKDAKKLEKMGFKKY